MVIVDGKFCDHPKKLKNVIDSKLDAHQAPISRPYEGLNPMEDFTPEERTGKGYQKDEIFD